MELGEGDADLRLLALPAPPDRRVRAGRGAGRRGGPRGAHPLPARAHRGLHPARVLQPHGPGLRALAAQRLLGHGRTRGWRPPCPGTPRASSSSRRWPSRRRRRSGPGGHILLWPAYTAHLGRAAVHASGGGLRDGLGHPARRAARSSWTAPSPSSTWRASCRSPTAASATSPATSPSTRRRSGPQHFGDRWPRILEAKKKFDPDGIMAPGFIQYE